MFPKKAVFNFRHKNRSRDFALDLKYSMHVHMNRIYAKALRSVMVYESNG